MKPFPRVLPCTEGRIGQDPRNEIGERCYIRKVMIMDTGQNRVGFGEPRTLGSLRSENGDVNENNEEKWTSHPLKHFFAIIPSRPVT